MDYCKGCPTYNYKSACSQSEYNKNGECPCCECLIKPMCEITCQKFENWMRSNGFAFVIEGLNNE